MSRNPDVSPAAHEGRALRDGEDSQRGDPRVVRLFMVVGVLVTLMYMLLFAVAPEATSSGSARGAVAVCGLMACLFLLAALWPRALGLVQTMQLALGLCCVGTGLVALVSGQGLGLVALAFVPMLLAAAATLVPRRAALGAAIAQGLFLGVLAALEMSGWPAPGRAAQEVALRAAGQGALLIAGAVIGLLVRRTFDATVAGLRRREQRFVGLLAVAADWYWETDAALRFTQVSEQTEGASVIPVERCIGRAPWDVEGFGLDVDAMDALRADLEARRPFTELVVGRIGPDGRQHWLTLSGRPRFDGRGVFSGYWGVGRDITPEREAELQRAATEARYRELFARSPSPLVLHRDGRVLDANVAALALFGAWSPGELIGQPLLPFYEDGDGSRDLATRRAAWLATLPVGEATPPQQFGLHTTAGRRLTVQVTSVNIEAEGGPAILSIYRDETERLRSELARERSEALLSHVVATSPDLITLTDIVTGRYVMVNDAFVALSGWTREEAIGRTAVELGVWGPGDSRERFVALVREQGELRDLAVVFRDRQGRDFSLLVSAARFGMEGREYLVINGRDVTRAERERLEREAILNNASIGIALTRDRHFQLVNPRFAQMFGWQADELMGQPAAVASVDEAAYEELGGLIGPRLALGEAVEFERPMRRKDGSTFTCRVLARPIDPHHPAKGATIWIAEDVTERRAVAEALARARDEAEAANRAKSAFLANTSHEIRTPLNGLVGLARLARQPGLDEARRSQYLAQIDDSARALSGVISDILDLSKIEAGKLALEQAEFDLHALLESIEHGYAALAEARSLLLSMKVAPDVPRRVRGDAVRVRQVLSNFLSNALKFTEAGSVRVWVHGAGGSNVRFEVEDTGPGIAPHVQQRLFMPFTQADDSTTRRYGGTGLGLSICRELAHLMGGEVGVVSQPGQGSRFWAELPLPAAETEGPGATYIAADVLPSPLEGLSLLIVEDNPVNMMIAVALLRQWGLEVSEAANGVEAVAAVHERAAAQRPFDLVLMDVQMPVQGGHEATRRLREAYDAEALPIIALTAAALTSERDDALAAGMNDFLTKPIDAQRLHDTLMRWAAVSRRQRLSRAAQGATATAPAMPPGPAS